MQISETHQKINRIKQARSLLATTTSLDDVYTLLNQLSSDVLDLYPHISCRTQCNTCCKGNSMPTVSPREWEKVHDYLCRFYTDQQRADLIARTRAMYNPHKEVFWAVHDTIQQPADMSKVESFGKLLPQLAETQCPMLVDEKCSVYLSRPAKCRAHGAFLFVFGPYVQMHSCESEIDKMEAKMQREGSRQVVMPVWNDFELKIHQSYNAPGSISTVLPLWILTHLHKGELIEDTDLEPDFEAFRLKDM